MPAGPAPTTATRSRGGGDGGPGSSSADTTRILSARVGEHQAPAAGLSLAAAVVVAEPVDDVLGEHDLAAVDQGLAQARGAGAPGGGRPGQPAVEVVQRAGLGHHAGDLPPLVAGGGESDLEIGSTHVRNPVRPITHMASSA